MATFWTTGFIEGFAEQKRPDNDLLECHSAKRRPDKGIREADGVRNDRKVSRQ